MLDIAQRAQMSPKKAACNLKPRSPEGGSLSRQTTVGWGYEDTCRTIAPVLPRLERAGFGGRGVPRRERSWSSWSQRPVCNREKGKKIAPQVSADTQGCGKTTSTPGRAVCREPCPVPSLNRVSYDNRVGYEVLRAAGRPQEHLGGPCAGNLAQSLPSTLLVVTTVLVMKC